MTTTRVRWIVGIMVIGLSLGGGFALAAESQAIGGKTAMTGDYHHCEIYIISGQGTATIGGQEVPFKPGTVLYIPNGMPYSLKAEEGNLAYEMQGVK
jgi:mannose-6-phosphate isomerase-like protein (cupin superfamily)